MEMTPREEDLRIDFACQFRLSLPNVRMSTILSAFTTLLSKLGRLSAEGSVGYGVLLMARRKKPFSCGRYDNYEHFIWKTWNGKPTKILTTFAWVTLGQTQIQCSCCGHGLSIIRILIPISGSRRRSGESWGFWKY